MPLVEVEFTKKPVHEKRCWFTIEFLVYYAVILGVFFFALKDLWTVCQPEHPNYPFYAKKLAKGWLGRPLDVSDAQWRSFRSNAPGLTVGLLSYLVLAFLTEQRLILSLVFLAALHGLNALKVLVICTTFYLVSLLPSYWNPLFTWSFAVAVLILKEFDAMKVPYFEGLYPRWNVIFNMCVLRLISFNMDRYFRKDVHEGCDRCFSGRNCTRKDIVTPTEYSFVSFLNYILYPPLYIAGPIITYNAFMNQKRRWDRRELLVYFCRLAFAFLCIEVLLHCFWVVAIKDTQVFDGLSSISLLAIAYLNLKVIWLKLLVIWRFFRFSAVLDGLHPPENMLRCMSNNYSVLAFWRSWHASYNAWIVRYLYVPLGGDKNLIWSMWVVFTWVALWHDLEWKLFAWAWLVCLFIAPEVLARRYLGHLGGNRFWVGIGGTFNVLMLMCANLVGFALGLKGTKELLRRMQTLDVLLFLVAAFSAVQLMMEWRAEERRHGITLKY